MHLDCSRCAHRQAEDELALALLDEDETSS